MSVIARRCLRQALATMKLAENESLRRSLLCGPSSVTDTQNVMNTMTQFSIGRRTFATSYLDKTEVTDRVLNVVKNFDKVDQSKVRLHDSMRLV